MTDHDAIAATIRAYLATYGDELLPDLPGAYLDLYDEVTRLRAERDRFEAALGRASQVGGTTYLVERAEKAEAERDALRAVLAGLVSTIWLDGPNAANIVNCDALEAARTALRGE